MSDIFDMLGVFAFIFGVVLVGAIGILVLTKVLGAFNVALVDTFVTNAVKGLSYLDWAIPLFLVLVMFLNFLTPFFEDKSPLLFFLEIIFYLLGIPLSVIIQNFMTEFLSNSNALVDVIILYFPKSVIVLTNLVVLWLLSGSFFLIGGHAKKRV